MTTKSFDILRILDDRIDNPLYNTSYPITPSDWLKYSTEGQLSFNVSRPIAFYIHIPFCKRLCSFCEYSKVLLPSQELQSNYLSILRNDIDNFLRNNGNLLLYGFDIGGGTPTALDGQTFEQLLKIYRKVTEHVNTTPDYEPSIEGTFESLTFQKAKLIADAGIHRVSLGVQSSNKSVLLPLNRRTEELDSMRQVIDMVHKAGIRKINLDLMYGLPSQSLDLISQDILTIQNLRPEQVTIYELRTNQIKHNYKLNQQLSYEQYCTLFDGLTSLGYYGRFGQNTFSLNPSDQGLSSYLRHRMFDAWQYKGFGLSAQSMSLAGVSYNLGKGIIHREQISESSTYDSFTHYALTRAELFAKFVAISGYSGGFSLETARNLYGNNFENNFRDIITALLDEGLIIIDQDRLNITRRGYRLYGAILSLFYK